LPRVFGRVTFCSGPLGSGSGHQRPTPGDGPGPTMKTEKRDQPGRGSRERRKREWKPWTVAGTTPSMESGSCRG